MSFFIDKYNFSRRVVDHRKPKDFHYSFNNNPFSSGWRLTLKNIFLGNMVNRIGVWYCYSAMAFYFFAVEMEAYMNQNAPDWASSPVNSQRAIYFSRLTKGTQYVLNYNNAQTNKGVWNHNFSCWSNEPYCGRDY